MEDRKKKLATMQMQVARMKAYREDLNDTNEDTLSLDQLIDQLESEIATIKTVIAGMEK